MIDRVLSVRSGAYRASLVTHASQVTTDSFEPLGSVSAEFPEDMGHIGLNYFRRTLEPLRHSPPGYVLEVLSLDIEENRPG